MTHLEKIKNMSAEEITFNLMYYSELLNNGMSFPCVWCKYDIDIDDCRNKDCKQGVIEWLNSEVENDD